MAKVSFEISADTEALILQLQNLFTKFQKDIDYLPMLRSRLLASLANVRHSFISERDKIKTTQDETKFQIKWRDYVQAIQTLCTKYDGLYDSIDQVETDLAEYARG
jgi:hypothetical protein